MKQILITSDPTRDVSIVRDNNNLLNYMYFLVISTVHEYVLLMVPYLISYDHLRHCVHPLWPGSIETERRHVKQADRDVTMKQ